MTTTETGGTVLHLDSGRDINSGEAFAAIGRTVQMRIGASPRELWYGRDHIQFTIRCAPMRNRKVLVQLGEDDLFHLEIGHLQRCTYEWVSEYVQRGIGVEGLPAAVEAGYVAVYSK